MAAAETNLRRASDNPAFLHAFWLLTQLPLAARGPDFVGDLDRLGVEVLHQPSLMDIAAGFPAAVDLRARQEGGRTDLGEMAQMAAVESLARIVGSILPSLFEPNATDVQRTLGRLASGNGFSRLARDFFARLTQKTLVYYLSRELANYVGHGRRFKDDRPCGRFDDTLARHCREASRLVEEFAGGWYGKTVYRGDGMTEASVRRFAPVAFKKIRSELRSRCDA